MTTGEPMLAINTSIDYCGRSSFLEGSVVAEH